MILLWLISSWFPCLVRKREAGYVLETQVII
jgi:hypothetical protein